MSRTPEVKRWERDPRRRKRSLIFFSQPRPPQGFRLPPKPRSEPIRAPGESKLSFLRRKRRWIEERAVYFVRVYKILSDHPEASQILGFTKREITTTFGPAISRAKEKVLIEIRKTIAENRRLQLRRARRAYEARHPERARRFLTLHNGEANDHERE